ncbi:MAG: hypothetical protein CMJ18_23465 [Phycisphaeraceae bacterium]|nr:hypothetical protein [Phycisphaeraceae bacterium]
MKLKLACPDFTFPLMPHDEALNLIAALEFRAVDIGLFHRRSHLEPSEQLRNPGRSARALSKKLDARSLKAADVFLQGPDAVNDPSRSRRRKARDWFQRTLEYAAACGSRHITISPGVFFEGESKADGLGRSHDELAWRIERAGPYRIIMGVEPHLRSVAQRPASALKLVADVPGLTLTLDYGHFCRIGIPDAQVEPLVAHASHFHVRGARKGALQASFEDNTIDFARVVKVMKATGYRGYLEVEYVWIEWEGCNRVDNVSETILFRDYLRSLRI